MTQLSFHKNYLLTLVLLFFTCCWFIPEDLSAASFSSRIAVSEEYSDNIDLDKNKKADWISVISPGFTAKSATHKKGVQLDYDLARSLYRDYSENDSTRHTLSLDSWLKISRYTDVKINERFIQTEEPGTTEGELDTRNSRSLYFTNTMTGNIKHRFGSNRSIIFEHAHSLLDNDNDAEEDHQINKSSLNVIYGFNQSVGMALDSSYAKGEYDTSSDYDEYTGRLKLYKNISKEFKVFLEYSQIVYNSEDDDESEDYKSYNPSAGIDLSFWNGCYVVMNTGYLVLEKSNEENESGVSLTGDCGKKWQLQKGQVHIFGKSGYDNAQIDGEKMGFTVYYNSGFSTDYRLSKNINAKGSVSYKFEDYTDPPNDQPDREDQATLADISLRWQPKKWISTTMTYRFKELNSTDNEKNYRENSAKILINIAI